MFFMYKCMKKFRIIKLKVSNSLGETVTIYYKIQKKFLFWFFDYKIKIHYFIIYENGFGEKNIPLAILTNRVILFETEEKAKECLNKIKNPFIEWYKGNKIVKCFSDNYNLTDCFINKSYHEYKFGGENGYEFSNNLAELKNSIDRRIIKTEVSIIE